MTDPICEYVERFLVGKTKVPVVHRAVQKLKFELLGTFLMWLLQVETVHSIRPFENRHALLQVIAVSGQKAIALSFKGSLSLCVLIVPVTACSHVHVTVR